MAGEPNGITSRLPNVLRVRLVGSLEQRLARIHLNRVEALEFTRRTDRGRARDVRKYFHRDIADALHYDLTINTDRPAEDEVVRLIGEPNPGK